MGILKEQQFHFMRNHFCYFLRNEEYEESNISFEGMRKQNQQKSSLGTLFVNLWKTSVRPLGILIQLGFRIFQCKQPLKTIVCRSQSVVQHCLAFLLRIQREMKYGLHESPSTQPNKHQCNLGMEFQDKGQIIKTLADLLTEQNCLLYINTFT